MNWYEVKNIDSIDSPTLLIYPDRVQHNIETMIANVGGNPKRLFPHVKTYKMGEIVQMQLKAGIDRFKCATISEMEMAIKAGAKTVLIAYQMTGPKIGRLLNLAKKYPDVNIASLVDNLDSAKALAATFGESGLTAKIYLDVDNGMHRTGCPLDGDTFNVIKSLTAIPNLEFVGLHIYDGQFRSASMIDRKKGSDEAFRPVYGLLDQIERELNIKAEVVNGGSPSFSSAAMRANVFCSPGTIILWDVGYAKMVPEVDAKWAAVLATRIISKPTEGLITVDLGHKSVGSENPLSKRIQFLNLSDYEFRGHSEEHLMIKVRNWEDLKVGDVLYGVPYHVCPSVASHDEACVIRGNEWVETWEVVARRRRITV